VLSWTDSRTFRFTPEDLDSFEMNSEIIATSIAGVLFVAVLMTLLLRKNRGETEYDEPKSLEPLLEQPSNGPPVSSNGPPVSNVAKISRAQETHSVIPTVPVQTTPQLPPEGLPHGWTMEQWHYYGHQYNDTEK
ncbi:MAG: hypothetical protein ACKVKS_04275, partial [Candidatus Poseidoniales archaeon]